LNSVQAFSEPKRKLKILRNHLKNADNDIEAVLEEANRYIIQALEKAVKIKSKPMKTTKIFVVLFAITVGVFILITASERSLAGSIEKSIIVAPNDGAAVYRRSCANCHGADGRGQTKKGMQTGATDLTSEDWEPDAARDTRIVTQGKGDMPGFRRTLKPAQIKSVVAYIRRFK
jgi:cytochrome c553